MKNLVSIFLLLVCPSQLLSQLNTDDLTAYSELEGSTIFDIYMNSNRNLWIATHGGLLKYDGYNFKRFHPDPIDSSTIADILVYQLKEDNDGYLWIGGMDRIYRHNPKTESFTTFSFQDLTGFPDWAQPSIFSIAEDREGKIYFGVIPFSGGTFPRGLLIYDENAQPALNEFRFKSDNSLSNVFHIEKNKINDDMWIIASNGIFILDENRNLIEEKTLQNLSNEKAYINSLLLDTLGNLYFTKNDYTLHKYHKNRKDITSWSIPIQTNSKLGQGRFVLEFDQNQDIWVGTDIGLVKFDPGTEIFSDFEEQNALTGAHINSIYKDVFNNLWIGTQNKGMFKYKIRPKLAALKADNNNSESITSGWSSKIYADKEKIWAFSDGDVNYSGINYINPATGENTHKTYNDVFGSNMYGDGVGQLDSNHFLLRYGGQYFNFNKNTWEVEPWNDPFGDSIHIFKTYVDHKGKTWYCTTSGLYKSDTYLSSPSKIPFAGRVEGKEINRALDNLYIGQSREYWAYSEFGLYKLNTSTQELERYGYDEMQGDLLPSQDINSLYQEDDHTIWIGTWNGGLNRLDLMTGKITSYTIEDGLPSMSIQGILPDTLNNALWLSTFNGISRFNLENEQFTNYDIGDGVHGMLFADGAYARTENGFLAFGGSNGITCINPKELAEESLPPYTYLKSISSGEKVFQLNTRSVDNILEFKHSENNLTVEYTGIHYEDPFKNEFSYLLEGYEENWRSVDNIREAYYFNIPPGQYTFKLKAANSRGVWNKEEVAFRFIIHPPWWKTWWAYSAYTLLLGGLIYLIYKNQREKIIQRERELAKEKELEQAKEIEKAYTELKATQAQLIQSEKMASLGELTAGIAHEIQNPLNFVNNFAEVSEEMIEEVEEELEKGDLEETKEILQDLKGNLVKISHHGKRASGIVRSMLDHSRTSSGEKVETDINALCDEYLRLAFHGMRARDRSFNADFEINLDPNLPKINVIPQDIGRVLLNLINNAFQATQEMTSLEAMSSIKPKVMVTTRRADSPLGAGGEGVQGVQITIADNGPGIPDDIKDKIFQPFFTTKPTGQGTGLGLSLAYDIVKVHGGEINVESKVSKGTKFIIYLPL